MLPQLGEFGLGSRQRRVRGVVEPEFVISDGLRKCVVFIGYGPEDHFVAHGTGFILVHKNCRYLVTARHIVNAHGDDPFSIRMNRVEGGSDTLSCDFYDPDIQPWFRWHFPNDETVDLAIIPFMFDLNGAGYSVVQMRLTDHLFGKANPILPFGIGDRCHAVGLFRKAQGVKRNVPIVHTGHLAMQASDERVTAAHWDGSRKTLEMQAHLVEFANLDGLSGSPVFARPSIDFRDLPLGEGDNISVELTSNQLLLLGVWQGSWEKLEAGAGVVERRPAGIGLVTPAENLLALLEQKDVIASREQYFAHIAYDESAKSG